MAQQAEFLTPPELAQRWNLHLVTLATWRSQKRGPAFVKIGTRVLYPLDKVVEYERRNEHNPAANDNTSK